MYDSVYPSRTARFGVALVPEGVLKLKNAQYARDYRRGHAEPCLDGEQQHVHQAPAGLCPFNASPGSRRSAAAAWRATATPHHPADL